MLIEPPIYLDGFATLPLSHEARDAMLRAWSMPGNAGSPHAAGEAAARSIDNSRAQIADAIGASPAELVFTSGATEANNLALLGIATAAAEAGSLRRKIVISAVEHKSVIEPARVLERRGFSLIVAPVDPQGKTDLQALAQIVDDETLLVSLMTVNNETGVIQPVSDLSAIAHARGALVHTDAAQALGKVPLDVNNLDVDYMSLSAHKCYGPMGVGALFIAAGAIRPSPLGFGGGQQGGTRPGTEPAALISGFAAAVELTTSRLEDDRRNAERLAELFEEELAARQIRFARVTGRHAVVPGSLALAIEGTDADALCAILANSVHLSTGSACSSGQITISHVLKSMGYSEFEARKVVRVFVDRYKTDADIVRAAKLISAAVHQSAVAAGEVLQ